MLAVTQIRPAQRRHLELGIFPTVVPRRRPLDRTVRNLVRSLAAGGGQGKRCLEQNVRFMPVDVVDHIHSIDAVVKRDVLHELRALPGAGHPNHRLQRPLLDQLHRIGLIQLGEDFVEVRIDIPRVVVFRRVLEGNQLVAAGSLRQGLEVRASCHTGS